MNKRLPDIAKLISAYSIGDFGRRMKLSNGLDDMDAIISGLHMLGQELKKVTISRDNFNKIFNSTSEMMIVASSKGQIIDVNHSVCTLLSYQRDSLIGKPLNLITGKSSRYLFQLVSREKPSSSSGDLVRIGNAAFLTAEGRRLPVDLNMTFMGASSRRKSGNILLTAADLTDRLEQENRVIRAIINAQEQDRIRMSRDFHDSIIQQIAGMHFYFSSKSADEKDPELKAVLEQYIMSLNNIIWEIRGICFDLMPVTLQDSGLVDAVYELCYETLRPRNIKYFVSSSDCFPVIDAAMRIDLYRVVQEFLNNSIRHGKARQVNMKFSALENLINIDLRDDGLGFDISSPMKKGMGLQNMLSRIKSHNGKLTMHSLPAKGTHFNIKVPIKAAQ